MINNCHYTNALKIAILAQCNIKSTDLFTPFFNITINPDSHIVFMLLPWKEYSDSQIYIWAIHEAFPMVPCLSLSINTHWPYSTLQIF